jgi:2-methylcitrate dehydratase PrpD
MIDAAAWVADLGADALPPAVRHQLRRAILDGLGAAIAGTATRTARIAARFARELGRDGPATVLATGEGLALAPAIFANCVAANALDIDDGYRLVKGHPGAFLITPALAAGEVGSPEALLPAIAAGYEIAIRAGIATHRTYRHYHASGSWGALGTAACLGRMAGLDGQRLRWAFGLAEYHAPLSPIERCLARPAMTKDGIAWGAFAGACAVSLAAEGFTGNPSLLEDPANADLFADLGTRWRLLDLYFKPYAACRWAQPAVDGVLRLRSAHGFTPSEVTRIIVHTFREAAELPRTPPRTSEEAQYNLAWPIAAALHHGEVGPRQVADEALSDPETVCLAMRVEAVAEPEIQARFPAEALAWVEVETRDGRHLRGDLIPAAGDPSHPLSDAELEAKFLWLTEPILGQSAARVRDAVADLEHPEGARALVDTVTMLARQRSIG